MKVLGRRGVTSVLFEGGGEVLASALKAKVVQKAVCFIAPMLIGGRQAPTAVEGEGILRLSRAFHLHEVQVERVGQDLMVTGYLWEN
jgi:diaminohydroxyphosphoribosylaminopyrimidine deaminase/5-amino-6-(5-phosphoribosylamino)uracil reductase